MSECLDKLKPIRLHNLMAEINLLASLRKKVWVTWGNTLLMEVIYASLWPQLNEILIENYPDISAGQGWLFDQPCRGGGILTDSFGPDQLKKCKNR